MPELHDRLVLDPRRIEGLNALLTDPGNETVRELVRLVERFGGPEAINRRAAEASRLENRLARLEAMGSPYLADLHWLIEQRDRQAFVPLAEYARRVRGSEQSILWSHAVTLEISALQYFPWLIRQARHCLEARELMPGRFIRVRKMAEQTQDRGDTVAVAAAMQIIGASYVETLDTKGTDGSNVHLGGPETITGYFGGIGQPNHYPLRWVEEYLTYYMEYGIRQVLNINPGTVLAGYLLRRLGVDNEFKISVFMGNDNPFAILWTLLTAHLFAREDGSTSLIGFNLSNSVDNDTIRRAAWIRRALGLEGRVRFEHHITETWKSIVRQPYNRRAELVEIAREVPNISAKHEGGEPEIEQTLEHPSDILDYFLSKEEIERAGLMPALERNYLEKQRSVELTAQALLQAGIGVVCAERLHR
ncbi:MAG: hypothetical protein WHT06_07180 [Desulfobacterales bacterium]